jgi:SP family myo-inositol transporter-like MFS transporter 13
MDEMKRPLSNSGIHDSADTTCSKTQHVWTLYLLTFFACIGGSLFGYDTGVVSGAMVQLKSKQVGFDLSDGQQEMVVSITTGGAILGSMLSGQANATFGRRPVIIFASIVFTGGAFVMAMAQGYAVLVLGRVIVGVAVGVASHTVPMYIAEAAPSEMRGFLVTLNNIFIVLGQVTPPFNPLDSAFDYPIRRAIAI